MFGRVVFSTILFGMTEIPRLAWRDEFSTACTAHRPVATIGDPWARSALRHSHARQWCRSVCRWGVGANVKVVQKLLGHKTAVLTLDRYRHLFPDDLDAVATAFDAAAQTGADWLRTGVTTNNV